ncbi:MAG: hypothetical protein ABSG23_17510, partial [Terriglobales bacterium]
LLVFSTHAFFLSGCAVETREFRGTPSASNLQIEFFRNLLERLFQILRAMRMLVWPAVFFLFINVQPLCHTQR